MRALSNAAVARVALSHTALVSGALAPGTRSRSCFGPCLFPHPQSYPRLPGLLRLRHHRRGTRTQSCFGPCSFPRPRSRPLLPGRPRLPGLLPSRQVTASLLVPPLSVRTPVITMKTGRRHERWRPPAPVTSTHRREQREQDQRWEWKPLQIRLIPQPAGGTKLEAEGFCKLSSSPLASARSSSSCGSFLTTDSP